MIKIASAKGFRNSELQKLWSAVELANQVLTSDQFRSAVIGYVQTDKKTPGFTFTKDVTQEIYQRITQDWAIDIEIVTPPWWKRWFSSEIAHESQDGTITLNRNKYSGESLAEVADTVVHETAHRAGYSHPRNQTYEWTNSAPEAVGNIVYRLASRAGDLRHAAQDIGMGLIKEARAAEVPS